MSQHFCGIDWGDRSSTFCIINSEGKTVKQGKIKNIEELETIRNAFKCSYLLESKSHWTTRYLIQKGEFVRVVNGYQSKKFSESFSGRIKTDKVDAKKLALLLLWRKNQLEPISYDNEERRVLIKHYYEISNQITDLQRQLRAELKKYFSPILKLFARISIRACKMLIECADPEHFNFDIMKKYFPTSQETRKSAFQEGCKIWIRLSRPEEELYIRRVNLLAWQLLSGLKEKAYLQKSAEQSIKDDEKYILTIPHVGAITGITLLYILDNSKTCSQAAAFSGLAPEVLQSGNAKYTKKRTHTNRDWQKSLATWAFLSKKKSAWASKYYDERKSDTGKKIKSHSIGRALGVKWIRIAWAMHREKRDYEENFDNSQNHKKQNKKLKSA